MLTMQARRLLALLEKRKYHWVSKGEMEGIGIRRHRDRVRELRALGYVIENRCARRRGPKLSEYRLLGKRESGAEGVMEGRGRSCSSIRDAEGAKAPATVEGKPFAAASLGSAPFDISQGKRDRRDKQGRQGESDAVQASKET